jgi:hypothetical protein
MLLKIREVDWLLRRKSYKDSCSRLPKTVVYPYINKNWLFRTYTPESAGQRRRIGYKGIFGHIILKADVFIKGK